MDQNDKHAIQSLFDRLNQFAQQAPQRDPAAEALIREQMARQDGSAYYLLQTVVMQEQALQAAQAQNDALSYQLQSQQQAPQGGFMSRLFGSTPAASPAPTASAQMRPAAAPMAQTQASSPFGGRPQTQPQGGGFLAGAAQTAMGVAGGMMLGSMLGSMFAGDAQAAEPAPVEEEPAMEEPEVEDFGDDSEW